MKRAIIILVLLLVCMSGSLKAFIDIPVWDVISNVLQKVELKMEYDNFIKYLELYTKFKDKLGQRVKKLITGFKGMAKGKITGMSDLGEGFIETLEESPYYAQYIKGTIFERVEKGEKLIDIVKERFDIEKELKKLGIYETPDSKQYLDEYMEVYKERVTRLEDRIKYIISSKQAGESRLEVFETRYKMFEEVGVGTQSSLKNQGHVGNEPQAIALLSESMIDTALQDQEISTLLRLRLEEDLSVEINKIYLDNLRLILESQKRDI